MATLELKKYLVSKINLIDDDLVLGKIKKLVDKDEKVYVLSEAQLDKLKIAEQQLLDGDYIDQAEMDRKFEAWLNEK
ncbi:hypothetical protein FNW52_15425 [Flavobacterium sp. ZT3R18]|uniref:hypothetical protein n=1 Tax=Flavobacterium sp. ZT3R18 TaxID=2594429 RepID=UPI00117B596F|nr:hypothetical protein [Flavobacterium sp. ZT3R18]TRX33484.1 hypothetical protein FNW52_15425 [Flavobacterium sp. ZT3R18]